MEIPTISIDMDKKCTRCHKGGVTASGLCMGCVAKGIESGEYDKVFDKIRKGIEPSMTATRKMTKQERDQCFEQLLAYENQKSECEERKADANAEFNRELKGHELEIDKLRMQLNDNTVEYDPQLKLNG